MDLVLDAKGVRTSVCSFLIWADARSFWEGHPLHALVGARPKLGGGHPLLGSAAPTFLSGLQSFKFCIPDLVVRQTITRNKSLELKQVGVPVYAAGTEIKPVDIARQGLEEAKKKNVDVVTMDTAGRLQIDKGMMDELKEVKRVLSPTEVLLVVDA
ncbi:hypothetical protein Fot_06309 [Forsythia ovata]|uniref:SRP54-type proteins GTP-binding domain-containing protein n=1 Tax=Forsythia ovata TaxID=205694 RepID=A0ABD1WSK6_9LAMI